MSIRKRTAAELRRHQAVRLVQALVALIPVGAGGFVLLDAAGATDRLPVLVGALVVGAAIHTRIRRPSPAALLRDIDPSECLLTAWQLEAAGDHEGLAAVVHDRASIIHVHKPLPWRVPHTTLALGLVLAAAGAWASWEDPIETAAAAPAPALDKETRELLARQQQTIEELQRIPHLSEQARDELERAKEQVAKAGQSTDAREAQGALSRAERSLSRLSEPDHPFFEDGALEEQTGDALGEALSQAMERGDTELAEQLVREAIERRRDGATSQDLGDLAEAIDQAAEKMGTPAGDMRGLAEALAEEEGRSADASVRELLKELREAREGQVGDAIKGGGMEGLGDEGEGKGEGLGEAESQGPGMLFSSALGEPGGRNPGGGHQKQSGEGDAGVGGQATTTWIAGQWEQGPQVLLGSLEGRAKGTEDPESWAAVHRNYAAVAEEVAEREQLPISRRDYVRDYFHAIRPR